MRSRWWMIAIAVAALGVSAHASERVVLRNGTGLQCHHHAAAGSKVRFFLSADENDYLEVEATEIVAVETVIDPPHVVIGGDTLPSPPPASLPATALAALLPVRAHLETVADFPQVSIPEVTLASLPPGALPARPLTGLLSPPVPLETMAELPPIPSPAVALASLPSYVLPARPLTGLLSPPVPLETMAELPPIPSPAVTLASLPSYVLPARPLTGLLSNPVPLETLAELPPIPALGVTLASLTLPATPVAPMADLPADQPPVVVIAEAPVAAEPAASARDRDATLSQAELRQLLARAGREHNLDVDLLVSIVKVESGGNTRARSRAGAVGLMQLTSVTAADLGVDDRTRPEENIRGGSAYLAGLLTRYHDNLALALAAYNAGPTAVDKYNGIPPFAVTRAYVNRVIREFKSRVLLREADARRSAAGTSSRSFHPSPHLAPVKSK